jgi:vacuolar-type H+-ATPase subunit H
MGFWEFFTVLLIVVSAGAVIFVLTGIARILSTSNRTGEGNLDQGALQDQLNAQTTRMLAETTASLGTEFGKFRESLRLEADEQERQLVQVTGKELEANLREMREHLDTELGRFREGIGGALATLAARQDAGDVNSRARQADAVYDLYQRLAKMEATVVAVANPVLLPSERLTVPEQLAPENLAWEQWKEVGDAAFAFADSFNRNRLVFDDGTCRELSTFVTGVREQLTDNIYPNLRQPTEEQRQRLRQALEQLGADISTARDRLEQLYREMAREG